MSGVKVVFMAAVSAMAVFVTEEAEGRLATDHANVSGGPGGP